MERDNDAPKGSIESTYKNLMIDKINRKSDDSNMMHSTNFKDRSGNVSISELDGYNNKTNDSDEYEQFKQSLYDHEDENIEEFSSDDEDYDGEYLDDDNESDYDSTDFADKRFVQDNDLDQYDDTEQQSYEEEEEYELDKTLHDSSSRGSILSKMIIAFLGLLILSGFIYARGDTSSLANMKFDPKSNSGSLINIQKQINHIYNELNKRDEKQSNEFDRKLKLVISQFEKNIKKLIPANVLRFQTDIKALNNRIDSLNFTRKIIGDKNDRPLLTIENITEFQNQLISELNNRLPVEVPVMINNSSTVMIIPELHEYITELVSNLAQYSTVQENKVQDTLKYDLNNYIKEILTNEFQYVDKNYFISELTKNLQNSKYEILDELKEHIQRLDLTNAKVDNTHQYSSVFLKKIINQMYNANEHQWENDLDFATYVQGTKLIKGLTSSSYHHGNGLNPIQLLTDMRTSTSTYWQCEISNSKATGIGCSFAIRFNRPLHLTKISYIHGRFTNNLHMMNSAPKTVSIYVRLSDKRDSDKLISTAKQYSMGDAHPRDSSYIKIGTYMYNLLDNKIKQQFSLPIWFIQAKPLVKSMIFQIEDNYGNKEFISMKKFIINGVTEQDLAIIKSNSFNIRFNEVPEYSNLGDDNQNHHVSVSGIRNNIQEDNIKDIPAFGQDEVVTE